MYIVRFQVRIQPDKAEQALAMFREVVAASRPLAGVVHFDVAMDVSDPNNFIATEVYADRAAFQRQDQLPVTQKAIAMLGDLVAGPPDGKIHEISSTIPWSSNPW